MDQEISAPRPSFLARLGKAFVWLIRFLLRLLVVLAVGVALGAGAYFGGTFAYRQYLEPVPVHAIRLDILEGRQNQIGERVTQRQDDLQSRLDALERQSDAEKLALDSLQERLVTLETAQADTMTRLEEAYAELAQYQAALGEAQAARDTITAAIEALEGTQDAGQGDLDALRADLEALDTDLGALQAELTSAQSALESTQGDLVVMQTGVDDLSELVDEYRLDVVAVNEALSGEKSPTVLLQELQVVKAMELLTRARLVLVQNNLGLAQFDIQAGRRVLVDLQSEVPAYQSEQIARIVARLDAALGHLPDAPVAAADELEGAWQLLIAGLPKEPPAVPASEATPEPTPTPEATPTPTPTG